MVKLAYKGKEYIDGSNIYIGKTLIPPKQEIQAYDANNDDMVSRDEIEGLLMPTKGKIYVQWNENGHIYVRAVGNSTFFQLSDILQFGGGVQ